MLCRIETSLKMQEMEAMFQEALNDSEDSLITSSSLIAGNAVGANFQTVLAVQQTHDGYIRAWRQSVPVTCGHFDWDAHAKDVSLAEEAIWSLDHESSAEAFRAEVPAPTHAPQTSSLDPQPRPPKRTLGKEGYTFASRCWKLGRLDLSSPRTMMRRMARSSCKAGLGLQGTYFQPSE